MKTDAQIKKDILDALSWDPAVHATDIGVIVKDGVVRLTGTVGSLAEKHAAERATGHVSGIQALAMDIEVRPATAERRDDADIAGAARAALAWSEVVPDSRVHVKVEEGWITLSGHVEWDYQRSAASQAVRTLAGVVGVTNLMTVTPRTSTEGL